MAKSGLIPAKPQPSSVAADEWVNGTPSSPTAEKGTAEPTSRITFDLPKSLHRRVMVDCTMKGVRMATVLRQMIEERWPAESSNG
jgi:hypothetical protein